MSLPLEFHPDVQDEIDSAYRWYDQRQMGLGTDFLDAVQLVLSEVAVHPARYGFAERDIREGLLTRFPYAVYYRELADRIRVLAVFHTSRDPSRWQSRS
ncbi:type II toxin-antitoxin system RelE/ParE family toxin [Zavarzinella formosa]|uniref:type II toxin-antitoxin system RelE/ParE family toxin n=1 Tax=Zavarzinella formosa TaxID=360055 RepID=UPI0002D4E591|nr:type II toxin-antitoxin system RelE/ParE family toxin [Zavarzinella formosa]